MSAHHDEQQELENAKHWWHSGGKWIFVAMVLLVLGYLGSVIYRNHQNNQNAEAAFMAEKISNIKELETLQQKYPNSTATAQASLMMGTRLFLQNQHDEAIRVYRWILAHNKTPLFQAAATQNLANILLQQKKYDEALVVLETPVSVDFQALMDEMKGDILAAQGKNTEAKTAYQSALDKLPEDAAERDIIQIKSAAL